jgi:hypothetical protein
MAKVLTLRDTRKSGWTQDRWRWLHEVRQDGSLSATARLVAHSLGFGFANSKTGECRPGVGALARDVKVSPRTIERCLTDLQVHGWIVRRGGNAPGMRARFTFRFPGEHTPDLSREHTSDLSGSRANSVSPPVPPYMEEPNLNHTEQLHLQSEIRRLPMPTCPTIFVLPGSVTANRWDDWLTAKGYPTLACIGKLIDGKYLMPTTSAPSRSEPAAYRIALDWAAWLRSRS